MWWVILVIAVIALLLALRWKNLKVLLMPSSRLEGQVRRGRGRRRR
jgi:hypothetical protein